MFSYIHIKWLWLYWLDGLKDPLNPPMDKKESSFMGLVGFERPLRGEKKLIYEKENLDSVLKSISTWKPACLKSQNVNIESEGVADKSFLNFLNLTC